MPCNPLVTEDGKIAGFICGPGRYSHLVMARCPWCCLGNDESIHATRLVYGGYCAPDMLCGSCGQYWTADHDRLPKMSEDDRSKNILTINAMERSGIKIGPFPIPEI